MMRVETAGSPTAAQRKLLQTICDLWVERLFPPSVREVMGRSGFTSPHGVTNHYELMIKKGLLTRVPGVSRGLVPAGVEDELRAALRDILDRRLAEIDAGGAK